MTQRRYPDKSDQPVRVRELTPPLRNTLIFIYDWIKKTGRVPTNREIMSHFGTTQQVISHRINLLERLGWVVRGYGANAYWPVGVIRTINFEFPARQLVGSEEGITEIAYDVSTSSGLLPVGSLERLRQIGDFAGTLLGMHPKDVETIKAAVEWIEDVKAALLPAAMEFRLLKDTIDKPMSLTRIELLATTPNNKVKDGEETSEVEKQERGT